ncbi:acyl carrier protein [Reinekea blandensis]|nr:acyl carrier protein [Reinekea blandensis]
MSDMEIRSQLRAFILENYLFTDDQNALSDTQSFLKAGILDSMGILELIAFLEEELGVMVAPAEMVPENLDSIDNLMAFIVNRIPA